MNENVRRLPKKLLWTSGALAALLVIAAQMSRPAVGQAVRPCCIVGPHSPADIVNLTGTVNNGAVFYIVPPNRHLIVTDVAVRTICPSGPFGPLEETGANIRENGTPKLPPWGIGFDHERDGADSFGYFSPSGVAAGAPEAFHSQIGLVFKPGAQISFQAQCTPQISYYLVGYLF